MTQLDISRRELSIQAIALLNLRSKKRITPNTQEILVSCPFHKDNHPSMSISLEKGVYHCFSCGRSGSIESLFKDLTGSSLYATLGISTDTDPFSFYAYNVTNTHFFEPESSKLKTVYLNFDDSKFVDAYENNLCAEYLKQRGISEEIAISFGMKYCENVYINNTKFYRRLLIPVREEGHLISIEGRRIFPEDPDPKVLYPKNCTVNTLFDIDNLDKNETLYACEGLMDLAVLRSSEIFKNSTSIFGAMVTKRQLALLKEFKKVVYIFDLDEAGERTVQILKEAELGNVFTLKLPDIIQNQKIKDIGDLPKAGIMPQDLVNRRWLSHIKFLA